VLLTRSVTLVLLLAACSSSTNASPAPTTGGPALDRRPTGVAASTVLDCSDPIATLTRPDGGYQVVDDTVALQTARSSRTYLDTSPTGATSSSSPLFAKTGLLVRTGATAVVTVPPRRRGRVAVEWGNTTHRSPTTSLHVPRCPGSRGWIAFPGGYFVRRPECVPIDVRVGNRTTRVHVGVGTGCRGQRPPPAVPTP